ncbi:AAA family ATPase [Nocardioides sp. AE5]|uniref:AAA family ATPase n=1 Tax=Nocardioides sp. AE5 TaxID=2962573 RepID=UPI002881C1AC|nr:AAA family ATPase [Nocardioides sp. AE5]MDT0202198.1 AAA family ATPase [Nocardioides sp. AE5]
MLGADDPLPRRPRRVLVAGVSGSGKTTLASRIGAALELPHTEIDGLFHGPGWTPRPEFDQDVATLVTQPAWVTEWQYTSARPVLAEAADLMVWLDLPFGLTLGRVVRRTVRRRIRREELWNGNREGPLWKFFTDPGHVVRWSISTRDKYREEVPATAAARPDMVVVRLRSRAEVERWIRRLA